jgi:hypothetical protein
MHPCARKLLDDIDAILSTNDPDAPMLISLSIQCWLANGNPLSLLMEALKARNIQHHHAAPILTLQIGDVRLRVPTERI